MKHVYSYSELKQIAVDLAEGKIFSNLQLGNQQHMLQSVFMVLIFLDEKAHNSMKENEIVFVYEYMHDAGPMAINGFPTFMSMRMLGKEDFHDMWAEYVRYVEMRQNFLSDYVPCIPTEFVKSVLTEEDFAKFKEDRERPA
jgi:hypothetical protein